MRQEALELRTKAKIEVVTHLPSDKDRHMVMNYVNCHNCTAAELVEELAVPGLIPEEDVWATLRSLKGQLMFRHVAGRNVLVEAASVPEGERRFYSPGIGLG